MELREALAKLDPEDDNDWTSDGLPRVDAVVSHFGVAVTREQITNAAPGLTRASLQEGESHAGQEEKQQQPAPWDSQDGSAQGEPSAVSPEIGEGSPLEVMQKAEEGVLAGTIGPEVLGLDMRIVARSEVLLEEVVRQLDALSTAKLRKKAEIERELKDLWHKSNLASRLLQRVKNSKPSKEHEERRRHLEQIRKAREERINRAKRFLDHGTTQEDVRELLDGRSKLDQAYGARGKPKFGQKPVQPMAPRSRQG